MTGTTVENTQQKLMRKGERPVSMAGIVFIMAYLILFSSLLLYGIMKFWPVPLTQTDTTNPEQKIAFLFSAFTLTISDEVRSVVIVTLSGALGSMVHALRSFYKYVGNRKLVWSWIAMYILLPFIGATLGLVFYLIIRGGFFPQATASEASPLGFMAMAAIAGLFSEQTILKLKEVFEHLLKEREEGKNPIHETLGNDTGKQEKKE